MSEEIEYPHYMDVMPDELKDMWGGLTDKQKKFIVFYVQNGNASLSARRAGYSDNCSKETGCENLTKPHIRQIVDWMTEYVIDNSLDISIMSKRERLQKLSRMASATHADFLTEAGDLDVQKAIKNGNIEALQEVTTNIIYGGEERPDINVKKLKLHDPVKIIAEMNKMDGSYEATGIHHSGVVENKLDPSQLKDAIKEVLEDDDC